MMIEVDSKTHYSNISGGRPISVFLILKQSGPLKAIDVMVGLFSEYIEAMRATAEVNFAPGNLFLDCQMPRFLRKAGGAYNKIVDLLQVFLRINDEYVNASLATEVVFLTLMATCCGLIFADLQPYQ